MTERAPEAEDTRIVWRARGKSPEPAVASHDEDQSTDSLPSGGHKFRHTDQSISDYNLEAMRLIDETPVEPEEASDFPRTSPLGKTAMDVHDSSLATEDLPLVEPTASPRRAVWEKGEPRVVPPPFTRQPIYDGLPFDRKGQITIVVKPAKQQGPRHTSETQTEAQAERLASVEKQLYAEINHDQGEFTMTSSGENLPAVREDDSTSHLSQTNNSAELAQAPKQSFWERHDAEPVEPLEVYSLAEEVRARSINKFRATLPPLFEGEDIVELLEDGIGGVAAGLFTSSALKEPKRKLLATKRPNAAVRARNQQLEALRDKAIENGLPLVIDTALSTEEATRILFTDNLGLPVRPQIVDVEGNDTADDHEAIILTVNGLKAAALITDATPIINEGKPKVLGAGRPVAPGERQKLLARRDRTRGIKRKVNDGEVADGRTSSNLILGRDPNNLSRVIIGKMKPVFVQAPGETKAAVNEVSAIAIMPNTAHPVTVEFMRPEKLLKQTKEGNSSRIDRFGITIVDLVEQMDFLCDEDAVGRPDPNYRTHYDGEEVTDESIRVKRIAHISGSTAIDQGIEDVVEAEVVDEA